MIASECEPDWLQIDWRQPWLADLRLLGQQVHGKILDGMTTAAALQQVADAQGLLPGWQFVDQQQLPAGMAYEAFIRNQRCIGGWIAGSARYGFSRGGLLRAENRSASAAGRDNSL